MTSSTSSTPRCRRSFPIRRSSKSWADTGVTPYPKDQRSVAAARALLKSEIARWGQVVRDNNIPCQWRPSM